ncbi:VMP30 protein [Danaus plexippus plexippus]|uniref:VMP30 protein n=1 Tax=Danaus plexippus plexippus TaxID=278856 RepID=A0A212F6M5_DANPL|nr:VMP30 protein [Danaus plexippus plexippus]
MPGAACYFKWECKVGCRCSAGFIRDEYSKKCVTVHMCPTPVEDEKQTNYYPYDKEQIDFMRNKKLNGNSHYKTPCQAAASASSSSGYLSSEPMYQNNFVPGPGRYSYSYGYAYPEFSGLYRSDNPYDDDREIMSYSDGNFIDSISSARFAKKLLPTVVSAPVIAPQAISSYLPINTANLAGLTGQIAQVGPAYGVLPNSNVGGCNVPLFFSCTPSIVSGRISRAEPHLYPSNFIGAPSIDYRGVEDSQVVHPNREENLQENSAPVKNPSAKFNENY